jgi:hypothetical protein
VDANLLITIGFIGFGAYLVLFNRSFAQTAMKQQKAVWKIDSSRYEKATRMLALILGMLFMGIGLMDLARILSF